MKLITAENCPFCMRCLIALTEKAIAFDIEQIDLEQKARVPDLLSPYGRVPVLFDGDSTVYESSVINEYLEDVRPAPPLLPADPQARATVRFWVDFADSRFMPAYFNLLKTQPGEDREYWRGKLLDHLGFMDTNGLAATDGSSPYWMGRDITLADIAIYPFFERFAAVEEYRGVEIPPELSRLAAWIETMRARPSVSALSRPRAYYVDYFGRYYAD